MVKNKDESKEESKDCIEKTVKSKKNKGGGYTEPKDPLTEKAPRHSASALKKDANSISDEVAFVPGGEHKEEKVTQAETELKKTADIVDFPAFSFFFSKSGTACVTFSSLCSPP